MSYIQKKVKKKKENSTMMWPPRNDKSKSTLTALSFLMDCNLCRASDEKWWYWV